jgi:hypothetical protein
MGDGVHHLTILASGVLDPGMSPLGLMAAVKSVAGTAEDASGGISEGKFAPIEPGRGIKIHTGHMVVSGEFRVVFSATDEDAKAFAGRLDEGLKALRGSARDLGFAWLATQRTEVLG